MNTRPLTWQEDLLLRRQILSLEKQLKVLKENTFNPFYLQTLQRAVLELEDVTILIELEAKPHPNAGV